MQVLAKTSDMDRVQWLKERQKGIGGSDASVILGLNKFKTPFELWLEKTGQSHPEEKPSDAAYFGQLLEDMVAKEFENRSGKKVRRNNFILQHPEHEFIIGNIDRKVVGEDALLECKTTSAYMSKEWEGEEIPSPYLVQVQHYLGVTGYQKAYVAVLIGGQKFIWKEIERDDELINMIFEEEIHFWNHHVLGNVPPALDGSSAAEQYLKERYLESDPSKTVDLGVEYKDKIQQLIEVKEAISELDKQKKKLENEIKQELQDAEVGYVGSYEVRWKSHERKTVDSKRLKKEFPDVYEKVVKTSISRPFKVKELV